MPGEFASLSLSWATAIYKLFQTTGQYANGSFGLLFAIAVVPAALLFVRGTIRRPSWARVLLLVMFWHVLLIPPATNLRYIVHVLAPGYIMLMTVLGRLAPPRRRPQVAAALLVLLGVNVFDYARAIMKEVREQARWGVSFLDPVRNRLWYTQFMYNPPGIPPETHRAVYDAMKPGERLAYCVICLGGLLYDPEYSYAVEFRSLARHAERESLSAPDPGAWLESLRRDGFDAVLVYIRSPEDEVLEAPQSGFRLTYQTPPGPSEWAPVKIYRADP